MVCHYYYYYFYYYYFVGICSRSGNPMLWPLGMAKQQKVNRICLAWQGMPGHDVWNCHTPSLCWLIHKVEEVLNVSECMMSCAKKGLTHK